MAYKFSKGKRGFGDINFEDDSDTGIDFEADTVKIETGGTERLIVTNSDITMSGDIIVDQKIIHNGDNDTYINFLDDKVVLKAGNLALVTAEKNNSAPHEVIINDGSNNVDFVVKGNGSRGGNPGMRFDASTNKLGINGVGTPEESLHVDGNIKVFGEDVRIKIDGDTDSHPGLELYENGTRKWIVFNDYTNDNLSFKTNSNIRVSIEQAGNVGIGTTSPDEKLHIAGNLKVVGDAPEVTVRRDNNADNSTIQFQGSGGVVGAYVKFLADETGAGGTNNDLAIGTGASVAERMRIRGDGNIGIGTTSPSSVLSVAGSLSLPISAKTSDYTATGSDYTILINASSNNVTITLPAVSGIAGRIYVIKRADGSGNNAVVASNGSETIDNSTANVILSAGQCITLQTDGIGWHKIAEYIQP